MKHFAVNKIVYQVEDEVTGGKTFASVEPGAEMPKDFEKGELDRLIKIGAVRVEEAEKKATKKTAKKPADGE